jgi:hypothetical protein
VSAFAVRAFFAELAAAGDSRGWLDRMMGLDDLNAAVGLAERQRFEAEVLDRASARAGRS